MGDGVCIPSIKDTLRRSIVAFHLPCITARQSFKDLADATRFAVRPTLARSQTLLAASALETTTWSHFWAELICSVIRLV